MSLRESTTPEVSPPADNLLETDAVDTDRETDPVADDAMAALALQVLETTPTQPVSLLEQEPVAICLKIGEHKREVIMPLDRTLHIGRRDPSLDLFPEIDVTNDGPAAKSVSRRQARISKQENIVIIVDEGSSNGTFVNQKKLKPFEYAALHTGDVVLVGKLQLEVKFLMS